MSDVWTEASRDLEAEHRFRSLQMAKQASQGAWSFLALAQDADEYEQRKAIALDALFHAASAHNMELGELTAVYDRQFGLLMQAKDFTVEIKDDDPDDKGKFGDKDDAPSSDDKSDNDDSDESGDNDKGNPFGKDDDDSDGGDDDKGKGGPPVTTKPHQKPSDGGPDDGGNGASDDGSDDDDDSDSDKEDDGKDSDDSSDNENPFAKGSSFKFQALLDKIEAGEDPRFFKVADATMSAGPAGASPSSMPDSGGGTSAPDSGASTNNATPDTPVTDTNTPTSQPPPAASSGDDSGGSDLMSQGSLRAIEADIRHYNPGLPEQEVQRIARVAYQKLAATDGESPLLYGDRGSTADGPMTSAVKNFSPPNLDGSSGGDSGSEGSEDGGGDSDSDSDDHQSKGGGGGGSGMAGAAAGAAMRVLPELLMASLKVE